jgi:hypothetical protein
VYFVLGGVVVRWRRAVGARQICLVKVRCISEDNGETVERSFDQIFRF